MVSIWKREDGYPVNMKPGDVDEGGACGECQDQDVQVTYTHTEFWGDPEDPTGSVEFWYCDDCLKEVN
jgi:hypothetical protein